MVIGTDCIGSCKSSYLYYFDKNIKNIDKAISDFFLSHRTSICVYYNTGNISISSKLLYSNNRGAHLKKLHRAEEGVKIVGVFRVKNHDFTPKNQIFSNCGGRHENFWGISCEKSRFYTKKSNFFQF